jgi:hypothetical protein
MTILLSAAALSMMMALDTHSKPIGETALLALPHHYACVDVQIRGEKSYPFILDTGASGMLLLQSFAKAQGFRVISSQQHQTAGKISQTKIYDIGEISVGGARWPEIFAAEIQAKRLPCAPGIDAVGALGMDFLGQPVVELDFPAQRIRFYQPKTFRYSGKGETLKVTANSHIYMEVSIEKTNRQTQSMRLLFDTGAPSADAYLAPSAGLALGLPGAHYLRSFSGGADNERFETTESRLPLLRIGGARVLSPLIQVAGAKRGMLATRAGASGLLGLNWARNRRLWLDIPRSRIIVEPGDDVPGVKRLGVNAYFEFDEKGALRVNRYLRADKIDAEPFLIGDRVLSVNGTAMPIYQGEGSADPAEQFWQLLVGDKAITLRIERVGKERTVRFTPKELLPYF